MSYRVDYRLQVVKAPSFVAAINPEAFLEFISSDQVTFVKKGAALISEDENSWRHQDEEMQRLSFSFPQLVFQLDIEGEESGDIRREYWSNGRVQTAKATITLEEFNENKLKKLSDISR